MKRVPLVTEPSRACVSLRLSILQVVVISLTLGPLDDRAQMLAIGPMRL